MSDTLDRAILLAVYECGTSGVPHGEISEPEERLRDAREIYERLTRLHVPTSRALYAAAQVYGRSISGSIMLTLARGA